MNTVIVYANPDQNSFNAAILKYVKMALKDSAQKYTVIDLLPINLIPSCGTAERKGGLT